MQKNPRLEKRETWGTQGQEFLTKALLLRREVARKVQNQLRQALGICVDGAV